jgi:Ras-related protein Rab-21
MKKVNNEKPASIKENMVKIALFGDVCTGKSALLKRFLKDRYDDICIPNVGATFDSKIVKVNAQNIKLMIWETWGNERGHSSYPMYFREADVCIIFIDLTDDKTLDWARNMAYSIRKSQINELKKIMLVGTKKDLDTKRKISYEKASYLASEIEAVR